MADRATFKGGRAISKRVVVNRAALDALRGGLADGLAALGDRIISSARPHVPDAPPLGLGLINTGGFAVYVDGRKVAGGASVSLGRRNELKPPRQGIALYAGYGFPGHLLEGGTINQPARPFLTPAFFAEIPNMGQLMRPAAMKRLAAIR